MRVRPPAVAVTTLFTTVFLSTVSFDPTLLIAGLIAEVSRSFGWKQFSETEQCPGSPTFASHASSSLGWFAGYLAIVAIA